MHESQSPRIGSCLQRWSAGQSEINWLCLNPLESGHVFRALDADERCEWCVGLNPLESGHVFRVAEAFDSAFRLLRLSQSPRIGSCLQSHIYGRIMEYDEESQSPRIGSCLQSNAQLGT